MYYKNDKCRYLIINLRRSDIMKKTKRFMILLVCMICVLAASVNAYAETKTTYCERGIYGLAWSRDAIMWTIPPTHMTIDSSTAWQERSGLFITLKGISKVSMLSTSDTHVYDGRKEFLVGAVIGGVTLGYATTYVDRGKVDSTGYWHWDYGV